MALSEFPTLKGIRGIGMSDSPQLASRLAEKFDYTNTFYHQAPFFDVTQPDDRDAGRFDFILSSEVMEHVPPPVERSFAALARLLKPDGLLLMTTPYSIGGKTAEHFPELHQYALASPGGRTVLVNRRRDGCLEIFENLVFHGGHGSTLEVRVFSEQSLIETLRRDRKSKRLNSSHRPLASGTFTSPRRVFRSTESSTPKPGHYRSPRGKGISFRLQSSWRCSTVKLAAGRIAQSTISRCSAANTKNTLLSIMPRTRR